eukprot:267439-Amorphochlora_amoeboformis.AAC.2
MITPYLLLLLAPTAASSGPLALRSRLHVPLRGKCFPRNFAREILVEKWPFLQCFETLSALGLMVRGPRRYGVRAEEPVRKTKLDGGWTLYEFG